MISVLFIRCCDILIEVSLMQMLSTPSGKMVDAVML